MVRVFDYIEALDAFLPTPLYASIARDLGLREWTDVVWIGRLFCLDNDFGEHWFDNWDGREAVAERAKALGYDPYDLLILDPSLMKDGRDGPCHDDGMRRAFWTDVLKGLTLDFETLARKAHAVDARARELLATNPAWDGLREELVDELDAKIAMWRERLLEA